MVDYATGTMGAFAISAALFQRMRTGRGQYIDLAMLDVAMIFQGSHITDYLHSGHHPKRDGNVMRFAASSAFPTKDGIVQLAASNARQHRRFYEAIGDPEEAKRVEPGGALRAPRREAGRRRREDEGEHGGRVGDVLPVAACPGHARAGAARGSGRSSSQPRGVLHRHEEVPGVDKPVTVPLAAFMFAHDGPSIERPPARVGEHTDEVLAASGYTAEQIAALRRGGSVA